MPVPTAISASRWSLQTVDDGLLAFDRNAGQNILIKTSETAEMRRTAPRVLQIGLLTPCNLHCEFCYRDTSAPSRLTSPFLLDLLEQASRWGVLEVAFGGGEPLLFRGFPELVEELHRRTSLGINFTTNGVLLKRQLLERLEKVVGEIRVSAYTDNHYRCTLRMARGTNIGVNWLVTPANVGLVEPLVHDCLDLGARNVLLLGYKGPDPRLHLNEQHFDALKCAVLRMQHLPLRLDVCWHPRLADVPQLFAKRDCGAGDEFLVITPDQAVQPCSFHHERILFESFEDLRRIYADLQARRPAANTLGCTRLEFPSHDKPGFFEKPGLFPGNSTPTHGVWFWSARAGNNSGDWTIVGRFREVATAQKAAAALRELARAHEAFLASPQGKDWLLANNYYGNVPSPPLRKFGEAHGFDWTKSNDGLWWEEDGCGAPVLTAGAVGNSVVVYHPYCMGLPEEPFRNFFANVGAVDFGYWQYDRPMVIARARGNQPAVAAAVEQYMSLIRDAKYASDVRLPPPWGEECAVLHEDEDRSSRVAEKEYVLEQRDDELIVGLLFVNTFAGALALEQWLKNSGYESVRIAIEQPLQPLDPSGNAVIEAAASLFGGHVPLGSRLAKMTPAEIIVLLFSYHADLPEPLAKAVAAIPVEDRIRLARDVWSRRIKEGTDVSIQALRTIEDAGPAARDWMLEIWPTLPAENTGFALRSMAASLSKSEAFDRAKAWYESSTNAAERRDRLKLFDVLRNEGTLTLIEQWWANAVANEATLGWGRVTAHSEIKWPTLRRWLQSGRPLSLIALSALEHYTHDGLPPSYAAPTRQEFEQVLKECKAKDPAPRASGAVSRLLEQQERLSAG